MNEKKSFSEEKESSLIEVRRYLEPGPLVLVSSFWEGKRNIMTMNWHTVMEFTPALLGCVISSANHSFAPRSPEGDLRDLRSLRVCGIRVG
jgi:flavin reductase (DIM6/NTAB) family NADH-FMN oxidoreductase RutF